MEDEWRFVVLSVGTFVFVFVLLLACVRSCARLSEEAVLGRMDAAERAQYLASTTTTASNGRRYGGRHIRWTVRPWRLASPVSAVNTATYCDTCSEQSRDGVYVISGGGHLQSQAATTAAYDVMTTRSIIAHYESQLPSYDEATSGLPSYDLVTECQKEDPKTNKKEHGKCTVTDAAAAAADKSPPEYCKKPPSTS